MAKMKINYFSYPAKEKTLLLPGENELDIWQVQADKEAFTGKSTLSREILTELTGRYLHLPGAEIQIKEGEHGKPYLAYPSDSDLSFNLSHCEGYMVLAFSNCAALGIDLESLSHPADPDAIAGRFFHPDEIRSLSMRTGEEKTAAFFRLWTMKEAFLKGLGTGLSVSTAGFTFTPRPDDSYGVTTDNARIENTKNLPEDLSSWRLISLDAPKGYLCSAAIK